MIKAINPRCSSYAWPGSAVICISGFINEDIAKLEKVQRQAARFIHSNYYDRTPGCVSKMVSNLGWESLQQRWRDDRLMTLFKIQHGLVEIDTDVISPSVRCTRGQHKLYHHVHLQVLFLPKDHPGMETPTNAGHDATTLEEFQQSRSRPANPPVLNSRQSFLSIFNYTYLGFNFGRSGLSLSPLTGQQ